MLQALRNKIHGWPAVIVLGIAVFAMSFFGIEGYFISQGDTWVAKVGKRQISQQDYQNRMNQLRQQMSAQLGDKFDPSVFDKPSTKLQVINGLVDQQLLLQANQDLGLHVTDQSVRETIASIPAFQVNGKFDATAYRMVLAEQGKTPMAFQAEVSAGLEAQILPDAIGASVLVTRADIDRFLDLQLQRRDIRVALLPRPALTDSKVSDAQVQSYYDAHKADFMRPEQVSVKYIEVKGAELPPAAPPSEQELKKRYEDEKQHFVQPEQRLVSHILIDVPSNATPAQQKAALAKAEKIASEATPQNFAKLAEQDSEDLGSKRQGGDLGWLERGMTNAAFDAALFSMQQNQISKPVLSEDGYHILWLRGIRSGQAKSFAEVRQQLLQEATAAAADHRFNDVAGQLADQTYQNPASLEPAAQALKLPVQSTGLFSRKGGSGLTANPLVIKAAFSDDVLAQGNNSALITLGKDDALVLRVDKHVPSALRPLAEVAAQIRQKILDQRVADAAHKQADALLAQLRKGEAMQAVVGKVSVQNFTGIDRMQPPTGLSDAVLKQAFRLPHPADGKPQFDAVDVGDGNYALLAVDKVHAADLSKVGAEDRSALRQQMTQFYAAQANAEYLDALRKHADIKYDKANW